MPLVGFSAQLLPYFMAMVFTMLVFGGHDGTVTERQTSKTTILSGHTITFNENPGATQGTVSYSSFTEAEALTQLKVFNRLTSRINNFYKGLFVQTIPLKATALRGPPSLEA